MWRIRHSEAKPSGAEPKPRGKLRIVIITLVFTPEMGALPNRIEPIARQLAAAGHDVSVATGMPNYPEGIVFPAYRGKLFTREQDKGFTILRTAYLTTARNRSKWSQLLSYLSFIPAAFWSGLRAGPADVVFATSPPIFVSIAGVLLAKLRRARFIFDVRDLWPDEIVACGGARAESLPIRVVRAVERWTYRHSERVCCTTPAFIEEVQQRGVSQRQAVFLPNGADLDLFRPPRGQDRARDEFGVGNRCVVLYAGAFGIKHGLEAVIEAATLLRDEQDIVLLMVGNGARRPTLVAQARGLRNVIFTGDRPPHEVPELMRRADVCLSTLLPAAYLEKIISVKIFEALACEKPVIAAQAGESARIVRESGAGLVVPPGDARAIADAILRLHRDPQLRLAMGKRGRRYVEANYSRSATAARLEALLCEVCGVSPRHVEEEPLPVSRQAGRAESANQEAA